ncbi:MAG: hypothetical protein CMH04_04295 [Marinovum sp.]|nr:hypothetical protein [Marinovum sp.]|tara:strand:+ start:4677 stop:5012 length:336 start_codon:yes stop_codon:yes gene_type:complete
MANTFKLKTATGGSTAANSPITVYTTPASTTTIVIGLTLSNLVTQSIAATVLIENSDGDNVTFLKNVPLPQGSALEVMAGNKVVLETGDVLKVQSNTANSIDTTLSIMEQT